jgi:hypothetical protein
MPHLVIYDIDPLSLGIIFPSAFPIFRMNEMDTTVLVGLSCGFSPIEILEPLHLGSLETIEFAHQ